MHLPCHATWTQTQSEQRFLKTQTRTLHPQLDPDKVGQVISCSPYPRFEFHHVNLHHPRQDRNLNPRNNGHPFVICLALLSTIPTWPGSVARHYVSDATASHSIGHLAFSLFLLLHVRSNTISTSNIRSPQSAWNQDKPSRGPSDDLHPASRPWTVVTDPTCHGSLMMGVVLSH